MLDERPERRGYLRQRQRRRTFRRQESAAHAVHPVGVFIVAVVAQFVLDVQRDQKKPRQPHGQSDDVDYAKGLVAAKVAVGDF